MVFSPAALLWVFIGGGLGATLRLLISQIVSRETSTDFPYGILVVNILGSFAIGALAQIVSRETIAGLTVNYAILHPFLIAGVLGGFTTFSAFSLDTLLLLQSGKTLTALIYVTSSVVLSIVAAYIGYILAR